MVQHHCNLPKSELTTKSSQVTKNVLKKKVWSFNPYLSLKKILKKMVWYFKSRKKQRAVGQSKQENDEEYINKYSIGRVQTLTWSLVMLFSSFYEVSVLRDLDHGLTLALILIIVITSKECCTTSPVADLFLKQI